MGFRTTIDRAHSAGSDTSVAVMAMIDVVFLLMIFFLFGSVGLRQQQLQASLASTGAGAGAEVSDTRWITLRKGGAAGTELRIDGGPWMQDWGEAESQIRSLVENAASTTAMVVDALPGVRFQAMIDTLALCERCGASDVSLRTD